MSAQDSNTSSSHARPTNTFITSETPPSTLLSLAYIRSVLVRLEDTICFLLIERAQFAHNKKMYIDQAFPELVQKENWQGNWLTWFLKETESSHAKVRRWEAPDEWPYTPLDQLPKPILPPVSYPEVLKRSAITLVHDRILDFYQSKLVPGITARWGPDADDGQYGSAAVCDVELLAALSRRIHFGMFVSESKFLAAPADFIPHILAEPEPNRTELANLITKPEVEAALLVRLEQKASVYGQDLDAAAAKVKSGQPKIDVNEVVRLYQQFVIPITKDVEVEYLVKRPRTVFNIN
ncbi:chorismate mutase aro7 [Tilletia horrida]|nr:chorismate mutase aro7 [Tilletia horrida]